VLLHLHRRVRGARLHGPPRVGVSDVRAHFSLSHVLPSPCVLTRSHTRAPLPLAQIRVRAPRRAAGVHERVLAPLLPRALRKGACSRCVALFGRERWRESGACTYRTHTRGVHAYYLTLQGYAAPSSTDHGTSGNVVIDYYWGMELYPRIFGVDVKVCFFVL
jgi:hypothetical protein